MRNRDVVFNEDVMYKDRKGEMQSPPLFPDITADINGDVNPEAHGEVETETGAPPAQPKAELPIAVRKAPRVSRVPDRYLSTMNYLLLTDSGEPEHFE